MPRQNRDRTQKIEKLESTPNAPSWTVKVTKLLEEQHKTQRDLADFLGVKPNTVSNWINGRSTPSGKVFTSPPFEQIKDIAIFFDVSIDYLAGLTEVQDTKDSLGQTAANGVRGSKSNASFSLAIGQYLGLNADAITNLLELYGVMDANNKPIKSSYTVDGYRKNPIRSLNRILANKDLILLIHDYLTCEITNTPDIKDEKAKLYLLSLFNELYDLRKSTTTQKCE